MMGASQWEEGAKRAERVFEDIMAKNVPNLIKMLIYTYTEDLAQW